MTTATRKLSFPLAQQNFLVWFVEMRQPALFSPLEQETTEDEIVAKMLAKYDAPEEIIRRDIKKIVSQLREIGAIDGE